MTRYLIVSPRDPIIVRDGRPFGAGGRMKPLAWPTPSLLAGSLRSVVGLRRNGGAVFNEKLATAVLNLGVAGPLAYADGKLWLPAPQDIVCLTKEDKPMVLRPQRMAEGEGCNLPCSRLLPMGVDKDGKAEACAPLWIMDKLAEWLLNPTGAGFAAPKSTQAFGDAFAPLPARAARSHTALDPDTLSVEDGQLFETVGLDFERLKDKDGRQCHDQPLEMLLRLDGATGFAAELDGLDVLHPLGGERRLARWRVAAGIDGLWRCPADVARALANASQLRMVLATPAIFAQGWLPGWLKANPQGYWEGSPLGEDKPLRLRLVGAALGRWQPVSGWSVEQGKAGPKPMRRMVGAGAVYFFDVIAGQAGTLADSWLASVSDDPADQRDGFGLALWGVSKHDSFQEGGL